MRIVSLVPSVTETLLAWGVEPVACTRFCEHPELPHVGGTKDPDVAAIVALGPDLVAMCEEENRAEDAAALGRAGVRVVSVSPTTVAEVGTELDGLATALGRARPPADPAPGLEPLGLRAFVPIWRRPWMTMSASTYGSSVLDALGITNVFAEARTRYPEITLDEAAARRAQVVLAPSEPYPFTSRQVPELEAVAPVVLVDGQDLFWWGVRTPAALARLHAAIADALSSAGTGRRGRWC